MPSIVGAGCIAGAMAAGAVTPGNYDMYHIFVSSIVFEALNNLIRLNPADVIKTKRQMKGAQYKGTIDCFRQVYGSGGISALFKGAGPRMMVQAPLFGITLLAFELQKAYMENH
jgi:hypothetical protein